jgi:type III pantothenate kinase
MTTNIYTFDFGNSNPKVGIWKDEIFCKTVLLNQFKVNNELKNLIFLKSSVRPNKDQQISKELNIEFENFIKFRKEKSFLDMPVNYSLTLGEDRLFQAYYIYKNCISKKTKNIILIDSGTFTTIDYITTQGFIGGYIIPGNQTYLDIYKQRGEQLTQFKASELGQSSQVPNDTQSAILNSLPTLLKSFYQDLYHKNPDSICIITGGGSMLHHQILSKITNSTVNNDLIHKSLHYIHQITRSNYM